MNYSDEFVVVENKNKKQLKLIEFHLLYCVTNRFHNVQQAGDCVRITKHNEEYQI